MNYATVELSRTDGCHYMTVVGPNGRPEQINLAMIGSAALVQWADYNLNRPAAPIEELVSEFERSVEEDATNRAVYSHAKSTTDVDRALLVAAITQLQAERDHWKANHDEMVARNKVLRDRPEIQGDVLNKLRHTHEVLDCGHPKQCVGRVNEHDRTEPIRCLWCRDLEMWAAESAGEDARTQAAVADALQVVEDGDSVGERLYVEHRQVAPVHGSFEGGQKVTIYWKDGGKDEGYVFTWPYEDTDIGACIHIPKPDARGDTDVSPEWHPFNELQANIFIDRIVIEPADQKIKDQLRELADWLWQGLAETPQIAAGRLYALAGLTADGARRLDPAE